MSNDLKVPDNPIPPPLPALLCSAGWWALRGSIYMYSKICAMVGFCTISRRISKCFVRGAHAFEVAEDRFVLRAKAFGVQWSRKRKYRLMCVKRTGGKYEKSNGVENRYPIFVSFDQNTT